MYESVFIWKYLNKCPELNNSLYLSFINLSYFRNRDNFFHPIECCSYNFSILTKNIDITMTINLFYNNCSTCNTLYFLDYFPAWTNQCTDQFFRNSKHFNPWSMWFKFRTWFSNCLAHDIQNMQPSCFGLMESF